MLGKYQAYLDADTRAALIAFVHEECFDAARMFAMYYGSVTEDLAVGAEVVSVGPYLYIYIYIYQTIYLGHQKQYLYIFIISVDGFVTTLNNRQRKWSYLVSESETRSCLRFCIHLYIYIYIYENVLF